MGADSRSQNLVRFGGTVRIEIAAQYPLGYIYMIVTVIMVVLSHKVKIFKMFVDNLNISVI